MPNLLEISKSIEELFSDIEALEEQGLEIPGPLQDRVSDLLTSQGEKIDNCAMFVKYSETHIDFLKQEKKILDNHIKRLESRVDRMKDIAEFVMTKQNSKKLEGLRGHAFKARVTRSVSVTVPAHLLPDKFIRAKTEYSADKKLIKDALESGEKITGCEIVEQISISVD